MRYGECRSTSWLPYPAFAFSNGFRGIAMHWQRQLDCLGIRPRPRRHGRACDQSLPNGHGDSGNAHTEPRRIPENQSPACLHPVVGGICASASCGVK